MENGYNLKYYGDTKDYFDNDIRIEIYSNKFIGTAMEIGDFIKDGISIITPKKKIYEPVLSTGSNIKILVENEGDYRDLFNTPRKEHRVLIKRNTKIIYNGFVEPDLYEERFIATPYEITIPCVDGLKILEDSTPDVVNETGLVSLMVVIKSCLREIGIEIPILVNCSLFAEGSGIGKAKLLHPKYNFTPVTDEDYYKYTNSLFTGVFIESQLFEDIDDGEVIYENAYEILKDCLLSFNCKIYQDGECYRIERLQDKNRIYNTTRWIKYNINNDVVTYVDEVNKVEVGGDSDIENNWIKKSQKLSVESPCDKQICKVELKEYNSVIFNNFDDGIQDITWNVNTRDTDIRRWSRGTKFTGSNDKLIPFVNKYGIDKGVENCKDYNYEQPLYQMSYITSPNKSRRQKEPDTYNFSFKMHMELRTGAKIDDDAEIQFSFGLSPWFPGSFMEEDDDKWTVNYPQEAPLDKYVSMVHLTAKWSDFDANGTYQYSKSFTFKELDYSATGTSTGIVGVFLYAPLYAPDSKYDPSNIYAYLPYDDDATFISYALGDVEYKVDEVRTYDNEYEGYINEEYYKEAPELKIRFFNSIGLYEDQSQTLNVNMMNNLVDKGDYWNLAWHNAVGWQSMDEWLAGGKYFYWGSRRIQEQLLKDGSDQYIESRNKIKGTFRSENLVELSNSVSIKYVDGIYIILGRTYNVLNCQSKIELEEVKKNLTHL